MTIRYIQPVAPNSTEGLVARVYPLINDNYYFPSATIKIPVSI